MKNILHHFLNLGVGGEEEEGEREGGGEEGGEGNSLTFKYCMICRQPHILVRLQI